MMTVNTTKILLAALLCGLVSWQASAADEPLIPTALNQLLPKIQPKMTVGQVEKTLSAVYPGIKGTRGNWSGQTGYIEYKLNERYTLAVSSITRDGKEVVHDEVLFYLFDWPSNRRIDLKIYDWEKAKKP